MLAKLKLKLAALLYKYNFPVYRWLYFRYKNKKESHYLNLLKSLLNQDSIILDIGGNIGFYTKAFATFVGPKGHVYSFEPDLINFRYLKMELNGLTNVSLFQKAVASESGILTLYTSELLNVDHRTYKTDNYKEEYSVEKTSIDDFVAGKFNVDLIKMDIQGFEMEALKGMKQTLVNNRNIILFTELWPWGLIQAGSNVAEVFDFISELEFKIYKVNLTSLSILSREEAINTEIDFFTDANIVASRIDLASLKY
jgi:FkbM family methyltransferase